jgi:predicted RND superfamily exporter protein
MPHCSLRRAGWLDVIKPTERDEANHLKSRKRFFLIVLYGIVLLPWIGPAAYRAMQSNANSPLDWVDDDFAPRHQYDQFCSDFGTADSVIISWPQCQLSNERIDAFVAALRGAPAFCHDGKPLFHQVVSGRDMVAAMMRPPISIPFGEAITRLQGSIVGVDGRATYVLIGFSEEAVKRRSRLVPLIRQAALHHCDAAFESQHLAGPIMDGYEVDMASQVTVKRLAPLSSLAVLLICYLCLDSISATLVVFGVSLVCQLVTMAMVDLSGGTMTALLVVLPPLVQVLAMAGGIHFVNYYVEQRAVADQSTALSRAFQIAWLPCGLSAVTTAIGLGSLGLSGLVAVRDFATYAAFGVLITVVILLSSLRGFFQWLPLPGPSFQPPGQSRERWLQLCNWQQRNWGWVCLIAFASMIGLGIGVTRLEASVRIETLFRADSRLIRDYAWLEKHVGSLVPIEVVASFDPSSDLAARQRLDVLRDIERRLRQVPRVDAVVSSLSFLPSSQVATDDHRAAGELATRQLAVAGAVGEQLNLLVSDADGAQKWRTTAYVSALGQNDYVEIMHELRAALPQQVSAGSGEPNQFPVDVQVSGLMPLVHDIQQQLLRDLFSSFLTAFALIAVVMTLVQAGILSGLLSMIPNVFPALTLFGVLGWLGRPLDIGSIMTASVAMGIAVDDTLHFLTFYQREIDRGRSRIGAVQSSYRHCGRAMIQTTMICGGGIAIFAFSGFVPTSGFAWMTMTLLGAALVGDLIVLPALLLSPLGKLSIPHTKSIAAARLPPVEVSLATVSINSHSVVRHPGQPRRSTALSAKRAIG